MTPEQTDEQFKTLLELPIGQFNFANSTKWIFNIPIRTIV